MRDYRSTFLETGHDGMPEFTGYMSAFLYIYLLLRQLPKWSDSIRGCVAVDAGAANMFEFMFGGSFLDVLAPF